MDWVFFKETATDMTSTLNYRNPKFPVVGARLALSIIA